MSSGTMALVSLVNAFTITGPLAKRETSNPVRGCAFAQRRRHSFACPARRHLRSLPTSSQRSEEHTSELQSHSDLVCRLLLEKKKKKEKQNKKLYNTDSQ